MMSTALIRRAIAIPGSLYLEASALASTHPTGSRRPGTRPVKPHQPRIAVKPSEEGYILVSVMFMLALIIIAMAVALPKISASIQRDRELETWHRGMQYRRAIQLYYRKFNRYPPNLDALVKTNEIRFLRKKYKDPTTGKEEWKPIMLGQNKTPLAMGFFGQPLTGVGMGGLMAGVGPSGSNGIAGANPIGGGHGIDQRHRNRHIRRSHRGYGYQRHFNRSRHGRNDGEQHPAWRDPVWQQHEYIWRADLRGRGHYRRLAHEPQAVDPGLQEEEPL